MFFLIPSNENGIIIDPYVAANIRAVMVAGEMRDVFIYSHGWWSSALDAMIDYNRFGAGLCGVLRLTAAPLAMGIHWPSMLSENQRDWLNLAEGASFFTMETRAEHVGRHGVRDLLRLILEQRRPGDTPRIHLIGHSFGCKVICAALAELIDNGAGEIDRSAEFNLVLLQPAIEDDALAPGGRYGDLAAALPGLRILITKSSQDTALCVHFKRAHALEFFDSEDRTALGAAGPSAAAIAAFGGATELILAADAQSSLVSPRRLVVADLSSIHRQRISEGLYKPELFAGQHSDIYFSEVYGLMAGFLCPLASAPSKRQGRGAPGV